MRRRVRRIFGGQDAGDSAAMHPWTPLDYSERAVLLIGSLLCAGICVGLGSMLDVPREPQFGGSLLAGGGMLSSLVVVAVALALCMAVAAVVADLVEADAGLFCVCMGLAALGARCGPMRPVLEYASGPGVFITLAIEVVLLGVLLHGEWLALVLALQKFRGKVELATAPNELADVKWESRLTAVVMQVVATAVLAMLLIQTDLKTQAMAGIMIASFLGACISYSITPISNGLWYWIGPAIVGAVGYFCAYFSHDGLAIGEVHGWLAPLARPTPLNYLGMGTGGAILGYWCCRRWHQGEEAAEETTASA